MLMPSTAATCQKTYPSIFGAWSNKIPMLKCGQPVQDSSFLCLCLLCDTPHDIAQHIQELSCLPVGLLSINEPYCSGNFSRLELEDLDSCVVPMLFYIEADMDFTKSLIFVSFDCMGKELSSRILATDDHSMLPLKEKTNELLFNLFQYIVLENNLYVRECQYNNELMLVNTKISAYKIFYNGSIQKIPFEMESDVFESVPIPPQKWNDF